MFGFLNVYKPKGKTSHDVVAMLRRITKIKQIGHTGTLDPFAEGVLPICIGKATRLIEYLDDDKAYVATVKLGEATTTYDLEGDIVASSDKEIELEKIQRVLPKFMGDIEQYPPIYSAIKVAGKKLYEYARKGEQVEIKPRIVNISELKILSYNKESRILELYVACSKGTYIRSIANDLGKELETYGHLTKLVRVKAGAFLLETSVKLEELDKVEDVKQKLLYPFDCLNYPRYELTTLERDKISHGMAIVTNNDDGIYLLTFEGNLVAVGSNDSGKMKCLKVFI